MQKIFELLSSSKDEILVEKFGLWLIVRERAMGLKARLLTADSSTDYLTLNALSSSAILDKLFISTLEIYSSRFDRRIQMPLICFWRV